MKRIPALDMLRGYALVAIMVDHMPVGVLRKTTLANFAAFDAAELFVLLSGFLVGLVWLSVEAGAGRRAAQWRFFRRAVQVWLALVLGGVLMALISRGLIEAGFPHTAIWTQYARWVIENPLGYIGTLATLWLQPNLLDVLALYVVVLAFTPLSVPLLLRWPWLFAAGSAALWAFADPLNAMLPNHRTQGGMLFNPFGWQALFHAGVAMGIYREKFMPVLRRHATALTIAAVIVSIYGLGLAQLWRYGPEVKQIWTAMRDLVGPINKWSLDWVRFTGIIAAAWLVAVPLAGPLARLAASRAGRALAVIGRGGLVSFVACVILSVLGDALMTPPGGAGAGFRLAVEIWTLAALWLVAELWARHKRRQRSATTI